MSETRKIRTRTPIHEIGNRLPVNNGYLLVKSRKINPHFVDYEVDFIPNPPPPSWVKPRGLGAAKKWLKDLVVELLKRYLGRG